MNTTPIAFDIVLLPDERTTDLAIELNRCLVDRKPDIELNRKNCLPHISLLMGTVEGKHLPYVTAMMTRAFDQIPIDPLIIESVTSPTGQRDSALLNIKKTPALQAMHSHLVAKLESFIGFEARPEMLLSENVSQSTLNWISDFIPLHSRENFSPHITIGYGRLKNIDLPIKFNAEKLALCHLADHCTCAKVISSVVIPDLSKD